MPPDLGRNDDMGVDLDAAARRADELAVRFEAEIEQRSRRLARAMLDRAAVRHKHPGEEIIWKAPAAHSEAKHEQLARDSPPDIARATRR